ncbi:DUF4113 domain-containing protein [Kocuria rosea]|uniref:DUF4113 domain-containing protein n=1 Tax=Kocuria rosea TaxID=1275 RepID=UPI00333FCD90
MLRGADAHRAGAQRLPRHPDGGQGRDQAADSGLPVVPGPDSRPGDRRGRNGRVRPTRLRRLRKEGEVTGRFVVFARTSPHRPGSEHSVSAHVRLAVPTSEPTPLVAAARAALVPKLMHGMHCMRAGILCTGLAPTELFPSCLEYSNNPPPWGAYRGGERALRNRHPGAGPAWRPLPAPWRNRQADLSPGYTTDWAEIRTVS